MQIATVLTHLKKCNYEYSFFGDEKVEIQCFCPLTDLKDYAVTWIKHLSNITQEIEMQLKQRKDMLIIVNDMQAVREENNYIVVDDPKAVFFNILSSFFVQESAESYIAESSVIETVHIGKNVVIGHHCYINQEVEIGDGVLIENNVSIMSPCKIGENSIIRSGVVIGTDGFGFYNENGKNTRVPHFGGVLIGKEVELGANTCVDRGTMNDTVICDNVKIDNLCHIGHNAYIEENCMLTAMTVLGGSCRLERNSYTGIGSVIRNQIIIGEEAFVAMGAVVTKSVEKKKVVAGIPAKVLRDN